jgi:hypothetical protein
MHEKKNLIVFTTPNNVDVRIALYEAMKIIMQRYSNLSLCHQSGNNDLQVYEPWGYPKDTRDELFDDGREDEKKEYQRKFLENLIPEIKEEARKYLLNHQEKKQKHIKKNIFRKFLKKIF